LSALAIDWPDLRDNLRKNYSIPKLASVIGRPPLRDPEPWERPKAVKITAVQAVPLEVAMAENASTHLSL